MSASKDVLVRAMNPKLVGKSLIEESIKQQQEEFKDVIVRFVTNTMKRCVSLEYEIGVMDDELQIHKRRLVAIEKGEFRISDRGRFMFNDKNLEVQGGNQR